MDDHIGSELATHNSMNDGQGHDIMSREKRKPQENT